MSDEIKSCPFCGSSDVKAENELCVCQNCGANAVKMAWNSRYEDHDNLIFEVRKLKRVLVMKDIKAARLHCGFAEKTDYEKEFNNIISSSDKTIDENVKDQIIELGRKYNGDNLRCRLPWEKMPK